MDSLTPEEIKQVLMSQRFADWYNAGGRFDSWITGEFPKDDPNYVSDEDILQDIRKMFWEKKSCRRKPDTHPNS